MACDACYDSGSIKVNQPFPCGPCFGTGYNPGDTRQACSPCYGTGKIDNYVLETCPSCNGLGQGGTRKLLQAVEIPTLVRVLAFGLLAWLLFHATRQENTQATSSAAQQEAVATQPSPENGYRVQADQPPEPLDVDKLRALEFSLANLAQGETLRYRIDYVDFGGGFYIPEHAKDKLRQLATILKNAEHASSQYVVRGNDLMAATTMRSATRQAQRGKIIANYMVSRGLKRDSVEFGGGDSATGERYVDIEITK